MMTMTLVWICLVLGVIVGSMRPWDYLHFTRPRKVRVLVPGSQRRLELNRTRSDLPFNLDNYLASGKKPPGRYARGNWFFEALAAIAKKCLCKS